MPFVFYQIENQSGTTTTGEILLGVSTNRRNRLTPMNRTPPASWSSAGKDGPERPIRPVSPMSETSRELMEVAGEISPITPQETGYHQPWPMPTHHPQQQQQEYDAFATEARASQAGQARIICIPPRSSATPSSGIWRRDSMAYSQRTVSCGSIRPLSFEPGVEDQSRLTVLYPKPLQLPQKRRGSFRGPSLTGLESRDSMLSVGGASSEPLSPSSILWPMPPSTPRHERVVMDVAGGGRVG